MGTRTVEICLAACLLMVILTFPEGARAETRSSLALPVNQGIQIYENGKRTTRPRIATGRFAKLIVRPRMQDDNAQKYWVPVDFREALGEMRQLLPADYYNFLSSAYGYVRSASESHKPRDLYQRYDNRISDLSVFIADIWNIHDKDSLLSRQFECMGDFEDDLTSFFMLMAMTEARQKGGYLRDEMGEAESLTNHLEAMCLPPGH